MGRTEHAGNVSIILNNFPKGFCEGLNWFMGADLDVSPLELRYFSSGCSACTLDLKIRTKRSNQAHERTHLKHIGSGGRPINFIRPKSLGGVYIYIRIYSLVTAVWDTS